MSNVDLPKFPKFKNLTLRDKPAVDKHNAKFDPYSDFNFTSLWAYDVENKAQISTLNKNLVIKMKDYLDDSYFLTFIGTNNVYDTLQRIMTRSKQLGYGETIYLVPEVTVKGQMTMIQNSFDVQEDRDQHDYVLDVDRVINPTGNKNKPVRLKINKFKKEYKGYVAKELDLRSNTTKKQILKLFEERTKHKKGQENEAEYIATKRVLRNFDKLGVFGLGIFFRDKMAAYTINELAHNKYCIGHFASYDYNYKGISKIAEYETAKMIKKQGYKHINLEQDLGIPGLRAAKNSWKPEKFLRKYKITVK